MSLFLILLLVAITAALGRLRLRRSARALFILTVLTALGIGCGPVPALMLQQLQSGYPDMVAEPWQAHTTIVVLGGGIQQVADTRALQVSSLVYARVVKGVELYRQCKLAGSACVLLVSGGDPHGAGASEAQVYAAALQRLGVDSADIVTETNSLNTWQNAQFCAAWLQQHPQERILLVTSGMHVRRSVLYFAHFGVAAQGVRADYVSAAPGVVPRAYNFLLTDLALHEYAGLVRYHVYQLLGLNIEAQRPGAL